MAAFPPSPSPGDVVCDRRRIMIFQMTKKCVSSFVFCISSTHLRCSQYMCNGFQGVLIMQEGFPTIFNTFLRSQLRGETSIVVDRGAESLCPARSPEDKSSTITGSLQRDTANSYVPVSYFKQFLRLCSQGTLQEQSKIYCLETERVPSRSLDEKLS